MIFFYLKTPQHPKPASSSQIMSQFAQIIAAPQELFLEAHLVAYREVALEAAAEAAARTAWNEHLASAARNLAFHEESDEADYLKYLANEEDDENSDEADFLGNIHEVYYREAYDGVEYESEEMLAGYRKVEDILGAYDEFEAEYCAEYCTGYRCEEFGEETESESDEAAWNEYLANAEIWWEDSAEAE